MKKKSGILNFVYKNVMMCCITLGMIITFATAAESIREMMKNEVTDASSLHTFYKKHSNPYEKRYFLQYLPMYLEKFEITEMLAWINNALDSALDSEYAPLSIAAVKSIGTLKLGSFSDKLTQGFIVSEQKAYLSLSYRVAVLESFKKFNDSEKMKSNINRLLLNFPQERICDPDFTGLMEATLLFCVAANAPMLEKFETSVDNLLERQEPDERRNHDLDRIKKLIQRTKKSLTLKGGHDE